MNYQVPFLREAAFRSNRYGSGRTALDICTTLPEERKREVEKNKPNRAAGFIRGWIN